MDKEKKRKKRNPDLVEEIICAWKNEAKDPSDVLGSYIGMTADGLPPVQDADDL